MTFLKKHTHLITGILMLFMACKDAQKSAPPISKDKMIAVMKDMHIAQAASEYYKTTKDSLLLPHKSGYYQQIFATHNITEEDYDTTYKYYIKNPGMLNELYEEMVKELDEMEAKLK